jgi:hypothetical protein
MFQRELSTMNYKPLPYCIFNSSFSADPALFIAEYLAFIPIFLSVFVIYTAIRGTNFVFVYVIAALTIINNSASLVFDSKYICYPD